MARAQFIEHRGVWIFAVDLAGISDLDALEAAMEEVSAQVRQEAATGPLLSLVDLRGVPFSLARVELLRRFVQENAPYVRARAALSGEPLARQTASALGRLSGRPLRVFTDPEEAKEWLIEQA